MADKGWVKLYRELLEKPIWQLSTPGQKTVLITLLMLANHFGKNWEWNGQPYHLEPGQLITSLSSLANKCGKGVSIQSVRSALLKFSKYGFLTNKSTKVSRLITIVNWGKYQGQDSKPTKQATDSQQSSNKEPTTNKNVKNEKNEKNVVVGDTNNPVNLWTDLWGFPNAIAQQDLTEWRNEFGDALVNYAINYAARRNVQSYGADKYLFKVFDGWSNLGITTVEEAENEAKNHEHRQANQRGGFMKNQVREKETLPDWAKVTPTESQPIAPNAQKKLRERLEALRRKDGGRTDEN